MEDILLMLKAGGIVSFLALVLFWIIKIQILAYIATVGLLIAGLANLILFMKYKKVIKRGGELASGKEAYLGFFFTLIAMIFILVILIFDNPANYFGGVIRLKINICWI